MRARPCCRPPVRACASISTRNYYTKCVIYKLNCHFKLPQNLCYPPSASHMTLFFSGVCVNAYVCLSVSAIFCYSLIICCLCYASYVNGGKTGQNDKPTKNMMRTKKKNKYTLYARVHIHSFATLMLVRTRAFSMHPEEIVIYQKECSVRFVCVCVCVCTSRYSHHFLFVWFHRIIYNHHTLDGISHW